MRPILKWAGGKRQLVEDILKFKPPGSRLIEPFVGGGALFFACTGQAVINDANCELINFYRVLRDEPEELLKTAETLSTDKETYYQIRALDREPDYATYDDLDRAARMLYLNKLAFNGMWRVNKDNYHNVPYNKKPQTRLPKLEHMLEAAARLKEAACITCGDYATVCADAGPGDFVYFDPPYHTSTFATYAKDGWGSAAYAELAALALTINLKGAIVCISNLDDPEVVKPFVGSAFHIVPLEHTHIFAAKSEHRKKAKEILIVNVNA